MRRRMFTDDIVSSGRFLRLSVGAQALYFHLGMNTDDDGIVEAFSVMRLSGAKEDDLVLLAEREFVTVLDKQELVVWMTGFQDFNKIDPRIKEDSKYLPLLLAKVEGVEVVESTKKEANRRRYQRLKVERSLKKGNDPREIIARSSGDIRDDPPHDPPVIHVVSIDKLSKGDVTGVTSKPAPNAVYLYWEEFIAPITRNPEPQRKAAVTILNKYGQQAAEKMVRVVAHAHADRYARKEVKCTSLASLLENWDKVVIYAKAASHRNAESVIPGK